jgi:hypothetical protein
MRRFVPLLVALLSGGSSGLAGAAADVLAEIVLKRMEASAKLRSTLPCPVDFLPLWLRRNLQGCLSGLSKSMLCWLIVTLDVRHARERGVARNAVML